MTVAFSQHPYSEIGQDLSTPDVFQELLKNPDAELVYLIELSPYSADIKSQIGATPFFSIAPFSSVGIDVLGGVETIYISDSGYRTKPTESPANTVYRPLTNNPYNLDLSIFRGEFTGNGANSGAVRLLNGDGDFDRFFDYFWRGRDVKVYAGGVGFDRDKFALVFSGVCGNVEYSEDDIIINISTRAQILNREFSQETYSGEGGLDGIEALTGQIKPVTYGECLRVDPALVDSANLVYQVHDASIEAVTAVYDRGVALTNGGDFADITAQSAPAGNYITQLSGGYFKLGSSPDGQVTADVKGDNSGGYIDNNGAIISRILQTRLGSFNFSSADIDQGALNEMDEVINGAVGYYSRDKTNAKDIIDSLLIPLQCYWTFSRGGMFTASVANAPSNSTLTLTENDIMDGDFEIGNSYSAAWRFSFGYARAWTSQSEIAAGATDEYRSFAQEEYRKIVTENRGTRTTSAEAVERSFDSLLVNQADAEQEAARIESLYNVPRKAYTLRVKSLTFRLFIGDTVKVKINRFGLQNGKDLLVTGLNEDAETGLTELELWG